MSKSSLPCRAKFIVGSVQALNAQPGGGDAFLLNLRTQDYATASAALCALPGVGPKVSALHSIWPAFALLMCYHATPELTCNMISSESAEVL